MSGDKKIPEKDTWEPLYGEGPEFKENHPLIQSKLDGNDQWYASELKDLEKAILNMDTEYFRKAAEALKFRKEGRINDVVDRTILRLWSDRHGKEGATISVPEVLEALPRWARTEVAASETHIRNRLKALNVRKRKRGQK